MEEVSIFVLACVPTRTPSHTQKILATSTIPEPTLPASRQYQRYNLSFGRRISSWFVFVCLSLRTIGVNDGGMEGMYPRQYVNIGYVVCHIPQSFVDFVVRALTNNVTVRYNKKLIRR